MKRNGITIIQETCPLYYGDLMTGKVSKTPGSYSVSWSCKYRGEDGHEYSKIVCSGPRCATAEEAERAAQTPKAQTKLDKAIDKLKAGYYGSQLI